MEDELESLVNKLKGSYRSHKEFYHNVGAGIAGVVVFSSGGVVIPAAVGVGLYHGGKWLYHRMEEKK